MGRNPRQLRAQKRLYKWDPQTRLLFLCFYYGVFFGMFIFWEIVWAKRVRQISLL